MTALNASHTNWPGHGPGKATPATVDVRDAAAVQALVDGTRDRCGRLDVLVNNAGGAVGGQARQLLLAHWDRVIDVNLRSVVHGVHAAYPVMIAQRFGHIVNTASLAGLLPAPGLDQLCAAILPGLPPAACQGSARSPPRTRGAGCWTRHPWPSAQGPFRAGTRVAVWALTFSPLLIVGRPWLFGRLRPGEQDLVLVGCLRSRWPALRLLISALRLAAPLCYFTEPAVDVAIRAEVQP